MSTSGYEVRPSLMKRSNSSLCRMGSTRVMPEHVGHDRVAGRASPLCRDPPVAAEPHDVPADQEELGQAGLLDDLQLVGQLLDHCRAQRYVPAAHALVTERLEIGERRLLDRHRKPREAVLLEVEIHRAPRGQLPGVRHPLRPGARDFLAQNARCPAAVPRATPRPSGSTRHSAGGDGHSPRAASRDGCRPARPAARDRRDVRSARRSSPPPAGRDQPPAQPSQTPASRRPAAGGAEARDRSHRRRR